jgi:hypothetical protein
MESWKHNFHKFKAFFGRVRRKVGYHDVLHTKAKYMNTFVKMKQGKKNYVSF